MREGTVANVPPQGGRKQSGTAVHPDRIRQIFCSFAAERLLESRISSDADLVERQSGSAWNRVATKKVTCKEILPQVCTDDILEFGLIPELVGRMPISTALTPLDEAGLIQVLTEPKNALIKQFKSLF